MAEAKPRKPRNQHKAFQAHCGRLRDIYLRAWREHQTHLQIVARLESFWPLANADLNGPHQQALSAYARGWQHATETQLEWRVYFRGKHVLSAEVPTGSWLDVEAEKGAHFWKGTDKRFDPEGGYNP